MSKNTIYTMQNWEEDNTFSAKVGQFVETSIVIQMREVVPPVTCIEWMIQTGDTYSHDWETGAALYTTFIKVGDKWQFVGHHPAYDEKAHKFSEPQSLTILKVGCDMKDGEYPDAELRNHRYYLVVAHPVYGALLCEISQWNKPILTNNKCRYTKESYMHIRGSHEFIGKDGWIECYGVEFLPCTINGVEQPNQLSFEPRYTPADLLKAVNKISLNNFTSIVESNDRDCLGMGW